MKKKPLGALFALFCCLLLCAAAPRPIRITLVQAGEVCLTYEFTPTLSARLRLKYRYHGDALAYAEARGAEELLGDFDSYAEGLYATLERPPVEASLRFHAGTFTYRAGVPGIRIEREEIKRALLSAYPVPLSEVIVSRLMPRESVEQLKARTREISSFTTDYSFSSPERKFNVELAASKLDGAILLPEEEFSFNSRVGSRTAENGFRNAPVIQDGVYTDGIGGGVCQVSSTLYNAALKGGLNVLSVHRHTLCASYVPPSFDAMVSEASDLVLQNGTDAPVFVWARAKEGKLTVTLFGAERYPGCEIRLVSVVLERYPAEIEEVPAPDVDEAVLVRAPKDGLKSEGYLELVKEGKTLSRTKLRTDVYRKQNGIRAIPIGRQEGGEASAETGFVCPNT